MVKRSPRKLAAILHADVVGSTALVRIDETVAHERIQDAFRRFSKVIESYGGVAHELRGDALVAEFARASDAVSAAVAFQAGNSEFNTTLDDDIQPQLRMGISLGEVVIADNTVTGAGVVLAQRLEQLAESGGVCIQGAAYETVPQRLALDYESLGEQEVKGFDEPVRAYAVTLKSGEAIPAPEPHERPRSQWAAFGVIALLVVIGGGLAWLQPWVAREEPTSMERAVIPLPDDSVNRAGYGRSTLNVGRMNLKFNLPSRWDARLVKGETAIYEGFEFGLADQLGVPEYLLSGTTGIASDTPVVIATDKEGVAHFRVFKLHPESVIALEDREEWMQDEAIKMVLGWYAGVYGYDEERRATKKSVLRSGEEATVNESVLRINYRTRHVRIAYAKTGTSYPQYLVFFFYNEGDPHEIGDDVVGTVIGAATRMFN